MVVKISKRKKSLKKLVLGIMALLLIFSAFLPKIIEKNVLPVEITQAALSNFSDDIYVSGTVEPQSKKEIIATLPIVPQNIRVKIGDRVNRNEVISDVDVEATTNALFSLADATNLIPQEYMEVIGKITLPTDMVSSYIPNQIISPASGVVTSISLIEGAISTPKSTMVTISDENNLRIKMMASEKDADKLRLNDKVVFKASATSKATYFGKITNIFPTAQKTLIGTSQSTVLNFYVTPDQNYSRIKAGYTVSGIVKKNSEKTAYTLPYECVCQDKDNTQYVFTVVDKKAVRVNVETGKDTDDGIEIVSPNLAGVCVIVSPEKVKNGSIVKIL